MVDEVLARFILAVLVLVPLRALQSLRQIAHQQAFVAQNRLIVIKAKIHTHAANSHGYQHFICRFIFS